VTDLQVAEMRTKLAEKIKTLEREKSILLEEVRQLKEVVELSEKAKVLENEVNKLKDEAKVLKERIPREFLQELEQITSTLSTEDEAETSGEECSGCEEEQFL
jgi:predicted  nucleic acid-binding Zn-ribbon protein